ncbi:hypothetical protein AALD01_04690 [Oscillospiraceae bacterium 21-37]
MYKEMRSLEIHKETLAKPSFVMIMENISNYIREDYLNSVDETTVYASLNFDIFGTDLSFRKVASPYIQRQKYRERG